MQTAKSFICKARPMTVVLEVLGYFGVFVFAVSGSLAAVRKDMDLFGVLAIAFSPALGGGTVRDLILDLPGFGLVRRYVSCSLLLRRWRSSSCRVFLRAA